MPKPKMLNKPSDADKEQIFEILGRHTVNLCGVCLEEDDNMNSNTVLAGWHVLHVAFGFTVLV